MATVIISGVLVLIVGLIIRGMVRNKKTRGSALGCSGCSGACACQSTPGGTSECCHSNN